MFETVYPLVFSDTEGLLPAVRKNANRSMTPIPTAPRGVAHLSDAFTCNAKTARCLKRLVQEARVEEAGRTKHLWDLSTELQVAGTPQGFVFAPWESFLPGYVPWWKEDYGDDCPRVADAVDDAM